MRVARPTLTLEDLRGFGICFVLVTRQFHAIERGERGRESTPMGISGILGPAETNRLESIRKMVGNESEHQLVGSVL